MEEEEWRSVVGYEDYKVSNMGRVKNKDGSIKKVGKNADGYLYAILYFNGKKTCRSVNILVGEAFIANPEKYTQVNHKDCNKSNNKLSNLEWMSPLENNQSKNKSGNIGYIGYNSSVYEAKITLYKIQYSYYNKYKKNVEEWLDDRRKEIKNNDLDALQAFKVNVKKKKIFDYPENMKKCIYTTDNGKYNVRKKVCGKVYRKRYDTYEEALEYLNELKELKIKMDNEKKLKVEKQKEKTKNKNEIKKEETKNKNKIKKEEKTKEKVLNGKLGCIIEYRGYYKSKFKLKGKTYTFNSKEKEKCEKWLEKARLMILNNEDIEKLVEHKKKYTYRENKEGRGCVIYNKKYNNYSVEIKFDEGKVTKRFSTREKAEELRLKLSEFETYEEAKEYRDNYT